MCLMYTDPLVFKHEPDRFVFGSGLAINKDHTLLDHVIDIASGLNDLSHETIEDSWW